MRREMREFVESRKKVSPKLRRFYRYRVRQAARKMIEDLALILDYFTRKDIEEDFNKDIYSITGLKKLEAERRKGKWRMEELPEDIKKIVGSSYFLVKTLSENMGLNWMEGLKFYYESKNLVEQRATILKKVSERKDQKLYVVEPFKLPLPCPECGRLGVLIHGEEYWFMAHMDDEWKDEEPKLTFHNLGKGLPPEFVEKERIEFLGEPGEWYVPDKVYAILGPIEFKPK